MSDTQQLESLDHIPAEHMEQIKAVAKMCHETNRSYLSVMRDTVKPWGELEQQDKDNTIEQVAFLILNPESKVSAWHDAWLAKMIVAGWKFGQKRSIKSKTHEQLKPFHHLPEKQQVKDALFHTVVQQAIHAG
ncbi:RyR domain-containing protein [Pseudoalteromonas sp. 1181_04]|uniref:RyR domain-containing protein n=1 Tax=Pseudoalteromonas sp. 1181_04 TaxID=2604450 RepID=UPI004062FBD6